MNKTTIGIAVVVAAAAAIVLVYQLQPPRLTAEHIWQALEAEERLARGDELEQDLLADHDHDHDHGEDGHSHDHNGNEADAASTAAAIEQGDPIMVQLETTKGDVIIELRPDWAPIGVQRFIELVETAFFDRAKFFRVVPGFVVQFGIAADPAVDRQWRNRNLRDEPVRASNTPGTVTFAKAQMPDSRSTQIFINLGDNSRHLDPQGFAPIGRVVEGMDVVQSFNSEYGESITSLQGEIMARGNAFLDERFPGLDYIRRAVVLGVADDDAAEDAPPAAEDPSSTPSSGGETHDHDHDHDHDHGHAH